MTIPMLGAMAVWAALAAAPAQGPAVYALVVANNSSVDAGVQPLRYADDDGARYYEFFSAFAKQASLLTVMDEETQRVHAGLARRAEAPSRASLEAALGRMYDGMRQDRAQGREVAFYFVFVGHGNVGSNQEGYVSLLDGHFTRDDLFQKVIAASPASFTHVVIDACSSYFMVNRRGAGDTAASYASLIKGYLGEEELRRFPNVGVVLSTSQEKESHEWAGFGAGVFSHEVLSALSGAADVNGDGRVEYSELAAYVAAANLKVDDPRAHLEIFAQPPALDRSRPLVDLTAAGFSHFLYVPSSMAGRFYLEDARGVRYADFNKAADRPLALALPPGPFYFLRTDRGEARVDLDRPGLIDASALAWHVLSLASRGSLGVTFQQELFQVPYGLAFYRGYVSSTGAFPVHEPQH